MEGWETGRWGSGKEDVSVHLEDAIFSGKWEERSFTENEEEGKEPPKRLREI